MKKALTYSKAFEKLEELIEEFEFGDIQLEKLSEKVKQANDLIEICETKLRDAEKEVKILTKKTTQRGKKSR
jgi:exodeoxyribonuclease VII small subunit